MNYTALSLPPDSLSLPLSLCISPSLLIFLPLSPQDLACLCECLLSVLSHVPVSKQCSPHGLCCRGMEYICLYFCSYTLFLPHVVSSCNNLISCFVFLHSAFLPNHCSQYFRNRIAVNSITAATGTDLDVPDVFSF